VSGHRVSHNTANLIYNQDIMLQSGQVIGFGVNLSFLPGAPYRRDFILDKNGTSQCSIAFLSADSGFKTTSVGLPVSFVAGDRLSIVQGYQGSPGPPNDSQVSWALTIRYTPP
jgi:hypothetical protein